jgi:phosphohistidine phosphatase
MASLLPNGVPIPVVDIDNSGVFKYVLIKIHKAVLNSEGHEDAMYVVRGHTWAAYHADLVDECESQVFDSNLNLQVECVGGGRIRHEPERKYIFVYGHSVGFGQANHALACELLKSHYHDYTVEWSNDGY